MVDVVHHVASDLNGGDAFDAVTDEGHGAADFRPPHPKRHRDAAEGTRRCWLVPEADSDSVRGLRGG